MKFHNDILSLIGNTPMVKINALTKQNGIKAQIFAKMENLNPGFSVKVQTGTPWPGSTMSPGPIITTPGSPVAQDDRASNGHLVDHVIPSRPFGQIVDKAVGLLLQRRSARSHGRSPVEIPLPLAIVSPLAATSQLALDDIIFGQRMP